MDDKKEQLTELLAFIEICADGIEGNESHDEIDDQVGEIGDHMVKIMDILGITDADIEKVKKEAR